MKAKWPLIITGIILFPLLIFALIVDWLTRYAYDRNSPKLPKFVVNMVMGSQEAKEGEKRLIRKQAEDLKEKAKQKVTITSYDGEVMVGHYYPCPDAKRIVIGVGMGGGPAGIMITGRSRRSFMHMRRPSCWSN